MLPRHAAPQIADALAHMRIVAITGPRQSGKSTLARLLAGPGGLYRTLDAPDMLSFAQADPTGFLSANAPRMVIDEIQRAPGLILPLKAAVDRDARPGRFLITGSADLFALRGVQDSLAGRIARQTLLPLSQAELQGTQSRFLSRVFAGEPPPPGPPEPSYEALAAAGGYPEAVALPEPRRRRWLAAYAAQTAGRDVADLAAIDFADRLPALLAQLALRAGQTVNVSELALALQLSRKTIDAYVSVLEQLYLVRRVTPWSRNKLSRLSKAPKLHFFDSGLAAALRRYDPAKTADRTAFGPLLETFVFAELSKLLSVADDPPALHHFRTRRGEEIDFILERWDRTIVAVEVKANATPRYDWFAAMRDLRAALGPAFALGVVLHTGADTVTFDDRMVAAPVSALWAG